MIETHPKSKEHHKTKNARGYMHPLSEMGRRFVAFSESTTPVMDMGCAYGNVVRASLKAGAESVIACDIEQEHLDILAGSLNEDEKQHLTLVQGRFPFDFNVDDNSIGAIHAAHILEYLSDKETDQGLESFFRWLKPGGKLFIKCYTIFIKELVNKAFQREYQHRLANHIKWPGYLENFMKYSNLPDDPDSQDYDSTFPPNLHMYDLPILVNALNEIGFEIEFAEYLDGRLNGATQDALYDGREYIGIIAVKPQRLS
jgi:ubiquinone/menaquinone biosynthesis C-methylase UbiE